MQIGDPTSIRRDNHYVPAGYLKRWALQSGKLWVYRTLVSHGTVPVWKPATPRGVARHAHLYTQLVTGDETDSIERWFDSEIESPAQDALCAATSDARMSPEQWTCLLRFTAAQIVRTPAWFEERFAAWQEYVPGLLKTSLAEVVERLQDPEYVPRSKKDVPRPPEFNDLPFKVTTKRIADSDSIELGLQMAVGRKMWMWEIRHALEETWKVFCEHRWTIVRPPQGLTWLTSDNPVIRLNFETWDDYNLQGGWANPGSEIMFPLGPEHLLYTQVGRRPPLRGERLPAEHADAIQRLICENAYRYVFSVSPCDVVQRHMPREVDPIRFKADALRWAVWHQQQTEAEREFD